uniref:Glycolipid transfer protein domain-containing protein n=1 Tax=Grammatophora oceanica TaxID=210454 RepID=A0A7S1YJE4_9STRA|mmetsp:Transcript_52710/g.78726  ORF Transcript_52710/g.78726 Transcript_52710/m.78726 type:complete len:549 (+) Transcript_52710:267-1913(+)
MRFLGVRRKGHLLGYISILLLGFMTVSNLFLVDAQVHPLESNHWHYDVLSTEVIAPPSRYQKVHEERPRLGLSAISSVTEALGPILPFAGGLDLRREWEVSKSITSVFDRASEAFGYVPRGGAAADGAAMSTMDSVQRLKLAGKVKTKHVPTLSASAPFVPIDTIASMTLTDVTHLFHYAVNNNREGHDNVLKGIKGGDGIHQILNKMNDAITKSRGKGVEPARTVRMDTGVPDSVGDIDALQFCAAMRVFGEWRIVRQVPDGYKGFAVGMSLGQKDIVQNVGKIEAAVHSWLDHRRGLLELEAAWENRDTSSQLRSPTLRELLEYEIDMDVHGNNRLPRLKDKTAAMGLLWVRRQLHYQTALFANVMQVPKKYANAIEAISAAYKEVYSKIHGWAVQKIFTYSFQAAPEPSEIYKFMNPKRLEQVMQEAKRKTAKISVPVVVDPKMDDGTKTDRDDRNPLEQFGNHISREWDKFVNHISGNNRNANATQGGSKSDAPSEEQMEAYVMEKMHEDAQRHIVRYLDVVQPLLNNVATLFDELNMDDPTKV